MARSLLAAKIGKELKKQKKNLATAESCTGGYISHLITSVSGSSAYFTGGLVAYDNKIKTGIISVKQSTLKRFGAVSSECACEMVLGVQKKFGTSYAVASTGIAGPTGGVAGKPVGTVYIAVAGHGRVQVERFQFKGTRSAVIEQSAKKALEMLWAIL